MREFARAREEPDFVRVAREKIQARDARRNSRLVILNGGLMFTAWTFTSPDLVLPAFILNLTSSSVMIGLAGALMRIGWAWPQVFTSRVIEPRPRKMPIFLLAGSVRGVLWLVTALLTVWLADRHSGVFLASFMVLYAVATSMMGISNVPWMDIVGKAVPAADRARIFALRRLLGGGLAMGAGALISYVLSEGSGLRFPVNYGLLFTLSALGTGLSTLVFSRVREPVEPVRRRRMPLGAYLASGLTLLKEDVNYRRLCGVQFLWAFCMMSSPFYVPYAISEFEIGTAYVGLFISVTQFSSVLSNALWAYLGHRKGNQALLVYGSYFLGLSVAVPLLAGVVPDWTVAPFAAWGGQMAFNLRIAFYTLTFVFSGFATSAMFAGRMSYVLDIAPANRRPTYTSFMNMFMLPQGLLPVVAGLLVAWISYWNMFLIALIFAPLSVMLARRLKEVGKAPSDEPG